MRFITKDMLNQLEEHITEIEKTVDLLEALEEIAEKEEKPYWYSMAKSFERIRCDEELLQEAMEQFQAYEIKKEAERRFKWNTEATK